MSVERVEIGSTLGAEETQQQTLQRIRSIKFIARCATVVALVYGLLYLLLGYHLLAGYNLSFTVLYAAILLVRKPGHMRAAGIVLMCFGMSHIGGTALLFLPPASGAHFYLMLVPMFSLIAIHPNDRGWWYGLTLLTLGLIGLFEWKRTTFKPVFGDAFATVDYSVWAAVGAVLSVALAFGVFRAFHRELHLARRDLHDSYERSESLLRNMLPATIAQRLKHEQQTIADDFDEATVLFADLVGFTQLAANQPADQTVRMLNTLFSAFDEAVAARDLEKIKTIGDAYMVAAGLPVPRPDHAVQLVGLATEFLTILAAHNEAHGHALHLRIGLCSGPLIAGVIGSQKLSYDVWGDTVNVASRMESTGIPGRIQVTEDVAKAASAAFAFEERGMVDVAGRGQMRTFLLRTES